MSENKVKEIRGFTFPRSIIPDEKEFKEDPFSALNKLSEYAAKCIDEQKPVNTAMFETQTPEELNNIKYKEITDELHDLYCKKNHDYGNAFTESFNEFGLTTFLVRLGDKYRRLRSLNEKKTNLVDESIEDTVMDIANYAIMTLMEMRNRD